MNAARKAKLIGELSSANHDALDRSFAAAAHAGAMSYSQETGMLLCAKCVVDGLEARADRELVGVIRQATNKDLDRAMECSSCGMDAAAMIAAQRAVTAAAYAVKAPRRRAPKREVVEVAPPVAAFPKMVTDVTALIGRTIHGVYGHEDGTLILDFGGKLVAMVMRDPEGNGPGALHITDNGGRSWLIADGLSLTPSRRIKL